MIVPIGMRKNNKKQDEILEIQGQVKKDEREYSVFKTKTIKELIAPSGIDVTVKV